MDRPTESAAFPQHQVHTKPCPERAVLGLEVVISSHIYTTPKPGRQDLNSIQRDEIMNIRQ